MPLPVVYSENYVAPMPEGHRFPMRKFQSLYELLLNDEVISPEDIRTAEIIDENILKKVHDEKYIEDYIGGTLDRQALRKIGLPWSPEILKRTLTALGGSLLTAELALQYGLACNTAGGTHHAFKNYGSGFCIFNDIALSALTLLNDKKVNKILIIDLDVHQGDGTAHMLADEPDIFTFSMHGRKNFPFKKQISDLDVELDDFTEDDKYLRILNSYLPDVLSSVRPDLVIYDAGVDPHKDDPLGRLSLTNEGLYKRDETVIAECIKRGVPVSCVIGGGYSSDLDELSYRHSLMHRAAARAFKSF